MQQKKHDTTSSPFKSQVVRRCSPASLRRVLHKHTSSYLASVHAQLSANSLHRPHNRGISKQGANKQNKKKKTKPTPPLLPKSM
jgi:hypothetical protein